MSTYYIRNKYLVYLLVADLKSHLFGLGSPTCSRLANTYVTRVTRASRSISRVSRYAHYRQQDMKNPDSDLSRHPSLSLLLLLLYKILGITTVLSFISLTAGHYYMMDIRRGRRGGGDRPAGCPGGMDQIDETTQSTGSMNTGPDAS